MESIGLKTYYMIKGQSLLSLVSYFLYKILKKIIELKEKEKSNSVIALIVVRLT